MSRADAARRIADTLGRSGYYAKPWQGGSVHRVYVRDGKGRQMGFVDIGHDGKITSRLDRQSGAIMAALPDLEIEPEVRQSSAGQAGRVTGDESADALRDSADYIARREQD